MPRSQKAMRAVSLAVAATMVIALSAAPQAQRRGRNDNSSFGAPIATNTLADNPAPYFGKVVTISAGVEEVLSTTAFVVDQRRMVGPTAVKAIGKPILVIAPYMTSALDHKNYLLMRGEVIKLDSLAIARMASEYKVDLTQTVTEKYQGLPVLLATSVLNATYTELARKPIPPPTAADVSLTSAMKTISPAFTALRSAADMSKADAVTENLAKLKPAFMQAEAIFGDVKQPAAAARAREASGHVASIETAVAAGNWEAVKTSAGALNQTCANCHNASRERQEDGTFRLKLEPTMR